MSATSPVEVVPADHAKMILSFLANGDADKATISYGVELVDGTLATLSSAVTAQVGAFAAEMLGALSDEWTFQSCVGRGSPADGGFVVEVTPLSVGTVTDEPACRNTAVLFEKQTQQAGRGKQGRMFLPGLVADIKVDRNGAIDPTILAGLVTAADDWHGAIVGGTEVVNVVLFHADYVRDPSVPYDPTEKFQTMMVNPNANTPTIVSGFLVDPVVATQRRRLR